MDFTKVTGFLESLGSAGIPGTDLAIYLCGKEVYRNRTGFSNLENRTPIAPDTIYPFYSMTKVITCTCALRLYEEGKFNLIDPVGDYLPEFKNMTVRKVRENGITEIVPASAPIRVVDLFTMSSGLTYNPTPELSKLQQETEGNYSLKEFAAAVAKDPLFFEPGTRWHYGISHDILGRLIEVLSGKTLGEYFRDNIFTPLDMPDTGFRLAEDKLNRLVTCYSYDEQTKTHSKSGAVPVAYYNPDSPHYLSPDFKYESGGGGLVSTVDDYAKFANALCSGGTAKCGYRVLGKATIELMRTNHLDDARMRDYEWPHHSGYGYGLGVRTMVDRAAGGSNGSIGEFGWSGMAGTILLIDPAVDLVYVYAQQLTPSKEEHVAPRLRAAVYGCL